MSGGQLWRVGHRDAPLDFTPTELYQWNHRFDDAGRRFRTIYCAEDPRTSLREVLAEFRPNVEAIGSFLAAFGEAARDQLPAHPVTASWRRQHVLAPAALDLDGPLVDLHEPRLRNELERRHAHLLAEHGLPHLDLHEITSRRRVITQVVAADLFDRLGAAAVRFPSRLDGRPALAVFEGRGELVPGGQPIDLTEPPPRPLAEVCGEWGLRIS